MPSAHRLCKVTWVQLQYSWLCQTTVACRTPIAPVGILRLEHFCAFFLDFCSMVFYFVFGAVYTVNIII